MKENKKCKMGRVKERGRGREEMQCSKMID